MRFRAVYKVNGTALLFFVVSTLSSAMGAGAQPVCPNEEYLPTTTAAPPVPDTTSQVAIDAQGDYFWQSGFESVGWYSLIWSPCAESHSSGMDLAAGKPRGFRLGLNLMSSPSPGNYLPPSPTLGGSSLPLLPPGSASSPTAWRDIGRPTLHGQVDLVTGLPLVQTTDLELPFGSAEFRLTRTRSARRGDNRLLPCAHPAMDEWWDWAGAGWMIGENPILIIDAALADVTGDNPRTSWLILDAHHSIPFQQIESNGTYEAPPRFRARMSHNGEWEKSTRSWDVAPTQYEVSLYDGAVKYTFVVIREDVPDIKFDENFLQQLPESLVSSSSHNRPFTPNQAIAAGHDPFVDPPHVNPTLPNANPGFGIPYYGLCVKIEDQRGHRIEINYCPVEQFELDDPASTACTELGQTTNRKGQINYIQLKADGVVEWTLVYSHRRFITIPPGQVGPGTLGWIGGDERNLEMYSHTVLDRIYVFEGEPSGILDDAKLSLPHTDGGYYDGGVDPIVGSSLAASATSWRYLIRYHYLETDQPMTVHFSDSPVPLLIRTSVTSRPDPTDTDQDTKKSSIFVYNTGFGDTIQTPHSDDGDGINNEIPWLHLMFTDEDIRRVLEDPGSLSATLSGLTIDQLAHWQDASGEDLFGTPAEDVLRSYASVELWSQTQLLSSDGAEWTDTATAERPPSSVMTLPSDQHGQYFTRDRSRLHADLVPAAVGIAAIRDEDGTKRYYRIARVRHVPSTVPMPPAPGEEGFLSKAPWAPHTDPPNLPMRSVFAHPYQWQGYTTDELDELLLVEPMDLKDPLWISMVDEFNRRDTMMSTDLYGGDGTSGTKPGQMSRRIVEVSPSGYVLKERRWEYSDDGISLYGGGLGEEFVYQTVEDYFTAGEIPSPLPHADPTDPLYREGYDPPVQNDEWKSVRKDLLLVEKRSVGWSAADLIDRDPDRPGGPHTGVGPGPEASGKGLIQFYEYDVLAQGVVLSGAGPGGTDLPDFETVPASARIQLVAEGVKQGAVAELDDLIYTRQIFRRDTRPTEILCQVEYTSPRARGNLLSSPPDYTSQIVEAGVSATHFVTTFEDDAAGLVPDTEESPTSHMVVSPPLRLSPDSSWYYPVEWELLDAQGNSTWSAVGLLLDPTQRSGTAGDSNESISLTYMLRDDEGRSLYTVTDTAPGEVPTVPPGVSSPPLGTIPTMTVPPGESAWSRLSSYAPLNYVTAFEYNGDGISDIFYPNGRRWARRVIEIEDPMNPDYAIAREFVFNNLDDSGGSGFLAQSPGEVRDYPTTELTGAPRVKRRVVFTSTIGDLSFDEDSQPSWQEMAKLELAPDSNGRLQNAKLLEPGAGGELAAVGSKEINDLGEVYREREIDDSILRLTRDSVGQVLRTYRGTNDDGWPLEPVGGPFNMILTERFEYGTGINDAWQQISRRTYESMPSWHKSLGLHTSATGDKGYYTPPTTDNEGAATLMSYDWRMRPVREDSYEQGDPATTSRLSSTLTWLDHADRPVLVVRYGAGTLHASTPDPTTIDAEDELAGTAIPAAADFYLPEPALRPTSIVQMYYGPDGSMTERRTYDMAWDGTGGGPTYLAEFSYSGKGGNQVYGLRPEQPIEINKFDGVGRIAQALKVRPGSGGPSSDVYELSRTDYFYDADGNANDIVVWTRVLDDGVDALSNGNAVRTRTVNWYDVEKRLIATAQLGTEEDAGFVPTGSSTPVYDRVANVTAPSWDSELGVNRQGLPDVAPLWIYVYDRTGNQTHLIDPDERVTEFHYSEAGRLVQKLENSYSTDVNMVRTTDYEYTLGKLVAMSVQNTNVPGAGAIQRSEVVYGAEILDESGEVRSYSNALVGKLVIPYAGSGPSDPTSVDAVILRYTFQGEIAEREDERGVVFRYDYDDLGRLVSIEVGHRVAGSFVAGYPASMAPPAGVTPLDRIEVVEYQYDDAGNLSLVTNYGAGSVLISQNKYDHDSRGSLLAEWQAIGEAVSASTPHIGYMWAYEPTDIASVDPGGGMPSQIGHLRLTEIEYPEVSGSPIRRITMDYGTAGETGDVLSRPEQISSNLGEPTVAAFEYFGESRRKALTLGASSAGGGLSQTFDTDTASGSIGLEGLDRFGRVADLHFRNGAGTPETMYRSQYTYDILGNRLTSRLTQAPVGSVIQDNIFSQLNSYDELNRLVNTQYGTLDFFSTPPVISAPVRNDAWSLDLLGNWVGGAAAGTTGPPAGRLTNGDLDWFAYSPPRGVDLGGITPDSDGDQFSMLQVVNTRNEIEDLQVDPIDELPGVKPTQYDLAGNLEVDGDYFYQYDAWNRLIQVNEASWDLTLGQYVPGELVKHYTYDAHGRLIRIQSPYPNPNPPDPDDFRTERLYYDGIRRIQEVVIDPVLGNSNQGSQSQNEQNQVGGGTATPYLAREYVWGLGDNGFDELLVQYDGSGNAWWAIMDGGGDLVALCDFGGTNGAARVVGQWTYDPYGAVLSADHLHSMALPHLGHKGLFLDRLDVGIVTGYGGAESPRLVPYGHTIYHNRNRVYAPALGRFMQRDPNATAMALLSSTSSGRGMAAVSLAFSMEDMYGDGMNLYEYLGSNPWQRSDPLGLSWDPFDAVDDYLAESAGSGAALLSALGAQTKAAAIVAATIASYLPFPAAGNLGELALYALGESSDGQLAMGLALGVVPGGKLAHLFAKSGLGKFIGKLGASAWKSAKHYASMAGSALGRAAGGLADRARQFVRRKPGSACGCFTAGTIVWTLAGHVPIEQVQVGDIVFTHDEDTQAMVLGVVTDRIVTEGAALLELTVRHESGRLETIETTDEHPFWREANGDATEGWIRADGLKPSDQVRTLSGSAVVESVRFGSERTTVYNLSISSDPSYLIGDDGLWVHNTSCGTIRGSNGFEHSFGRHGKEWAQRWGVKVDRDEWLRILEDANRSSVEGFGDLKGTKTLIKFARVDGNKPIFLQWFAEGPKAGEFATAFIPTSQQIQNFFQSQK